MSWSDSTISSRRAPPGSASVCVNVSRCGRPPKLCSVCATTVAVAGGCVRSRNTSSLGFSHEGLVGAGDPRT